MQQARKSVIPRVWGLGVRSWSLIDTYVLARITGRPSTASFWYLPEPAAVHDETSLGAYRSHLASSSPRYLIDYRAKLQYSVESDEGIVVLHYRQPVGVQLNPLAAFQYALGLHDHAVLNESAASRRRFLEYCEFFRDRQSVDGSWFYTFDWYRCKAPWASALAQSKGASIMLRAWRLTGREEFLECAMRAISLFHVPISEGGFLNEFGPDGVPYFEEYPPEPNCAINGFMGALFGVWEVATWTKNPQTCKLWESGIASLEKLLPYFTSSWWSIYDKDPASPIVNYHSPRYHRMVTDYLRVFAALHPTPTLIYFRDTWMHFDNHIGRWRALAAKSTRKILYR